MTTSTIIVCVVIALLILGTWAYVITMFIHMCGRVDDSIIRIIFKKEFPTLPLHPVPVDEKVSEEKLETEEENINENDNGAIPGV